jgi:penicillin-binding protein 1A
VALDPRDGAVRAFVGGRDYNDSKFNRAVQALRQPGSTFKPIVYAAAIHAGLSPATVVEDAPVSVPQVDGTVWTPQNYDGKFQGPMTLRRALYESRNLVAVRLGMQLGEEAVIEMARRFGISTPIPPYPSIHIGSAEVYPLQLIAAYSTFANLGMRVEPRAIVRVEDQAGNVLWAPTPNVTPVLPPAEAWIMVNMLKDVVLRGTAFARVWNAGFHLPSAGKTGTTNDGADVWYVGFTADLVAGVWIGFDRPKKIMTDAQGGRLAAPAFTAFMLDAYRRKPEPPDWPRPAAVLARQVDSLTGLLAGPACASRAYTEYFLPGTEPHRICRPGELGMQALRADSTGDGSRRREIANPFRIP